MRRTANKPGSSIAGNISYAFFLAFALAVGSLYGWASRSSLLRSTLTNPIAFLDKDPKTAFGDKDSETLLILGCDEDRFFHGTYANGSNIYKKYARSDMMLLAKLNFLTNTITGLSIPRDTMARIPGAKGLLAGRHKINAFHELAKTTEADEMTKEAVQQVIPGIEIDKVVDLDFDAIQKLVDIVGGVELNVPKRMKYDDNAGELHVNLFPGMQRLNGYNAMCFVRFRHDRESDFGRQQRQKDFLTAFKKSVFQNPLRLPEIAEQGKACLNNALNDDELMAFASFARRVPAQNIKMGMLPVVDGPGSFLVVDKARLPRVLREFGFNARLGADLLADDKP